MISQWFAMNSVLIDQTLVVFLLALSIQIPLRLGVISFAGIGYFAIGGYGTGILVLQQGWNNVAAIIVCSIVAAIVATLLGFIIAHLNGLYLGMATVSFSLLFSAIAINGGSLTGGAVGLYGLIGPIETWHVALVTAVIVALVYLSERGRISRRIDAAKEDTQLASALGINVIFMRRMSFPISGALGGLAGAFSISLKTTIHPESINFSLVILALTIIIIGGQASWVGALFGSLFFVWLPELLEFVGDFEAIVYGIVVVVAAVYLPGGVVVVYKDWKHRRQVKKFLAQAPDAPPKDELAGVSGESKEGAS